MDREMRLATYVCMFGHQFKCPLCVVCSGGGVERCRSGMSEYICMYVLENTNELWHTTKFVHQLQCKHQLCVWGGGGGGGGDD